MPHFVPLPYCRDRGIRSVVAGAVIATGVMMACSSVAMAEDIKLLASNAAVRRTRNFCLPELQSVTVFSAGLLTRAPAADAARTLIGYLAGPQAAPVLKACK